MQHKSLVRPIVLAVSSALLFIGTATPVLTNAVLSQLSPDETISTVAHPDLSAEIHLVDGGSTGGGGTCAGSGC